MRDSSRASTFRTCSGSTSASTRRGSSGSCPTAPSGRECGPLTGLIDTPVLRPDGSLLDTPGYDAATGLYLVSAMPLSVPAEPTRDQARTALQRLRELASRLPFAQGEHATAFIASLLTPFAWLAVDRPAPLFVFDAPTERAPLLLADLVSLIVRGQPTSLESGEYSVEARHSSDAKPRSIHDACV